MSMMPRLRSNEKTDLTDGFWGKCENCETETIVRRVEAFSVMSLGKEKASRGFYKICFKCEGPKILWKSKEYGSMRSPIYMESEELDLLIADYFKDIIQKLRPSKEES